MIDITMPALSPTMEAGTLAKWHVQVGDRVSAGDVIAEIETDKATMEVEAVDEGEVAELVVAEGAEDVAVNAVIARLKGEGEDAAPPLAASEGEPERAEQKPAAPSAEREAARPDDAPPAERAAPPSRPLAEGGQEPRIAATPLARRLAALWGVELAGLRGSGPRGRIVKADVETAHQGAAAPAAGPAAAAADPAHAQPRAEAPPAREASAAQPPASDVPHEEVRLSQMRRTIARRLTESKQTVPHFYLTIDTRLDALLALRSELNAVLDAEGVKLSVNDLLIKALARALEQVPDANVSFAGDTLRRFQRADIAVAVAIPGGLITPVVRDAGTKRLGAIAREMKDLAACAREGRLQPHEYRGGTASLSNLGMYGIRQFDAVINPPEGMILAVGAGEPRPIVDGGEVKAATMMSATGSFDHRAIDGATGAELMAALRRLIEAPLGLVA